MYFNADHWDGVRDTLRILDCGGNKHHLHKVSTVTARQRAHAHCTQAATTAARAALAAMHDSIWGRRHMSHAAARVCGGEMFAKRVLVVFLSCLGAVLVGPKTIDRAFFFLHPSLYTPPPTVGV